MNYLLALVVLGLVFLFVFLKSQSSKQKNGGSPGKPEPKLKQDMKRMSLYSEEVVGVYKKNSNGSRRQSYIRRLKAGDPIQLYRDPNNSEDPNAIKVHSKKGQIGFIKAFRAQELAPQMDRGYMTECSVKELLPDQDKNVYGIVINIQRYKP
jgi:hypothetical protein